MKTVPCGVTWCVAVVPYPGGICPPHRKKGDLRPELNGRSKKYYYGRRVRPSEDRRL